MKKEGPPNSIYLGYTACCISAASKNRYAQLLYPADRP